MSDQLNRFVDKKLLQVKETREPFSQLNSLKINI